MPAQERKFIGFREQLAQKRAQRYEGTEPEPWLVRKLAVIITICILGYVYYVFVVGVCVPMVREEQGRQGSKGQGVVYLVIYHLLWIMIIWSYIMVLFTGPGYAKDYVNPSPPPQSQDQGTVPGPPYEKIQPAHEQAHGHLAPPQSPRNDAVSQVSPNRDTGSQASQSSGGRNSRTSSVVSSMNLNFFNPLRNQNQTASNQPDPSEMHEILQQTSEPSEPRHSYGLGDEEEDEEDISTEQDTASFFTASMDGHQPESRPTTSGGLPSRPSSGIKGQSQISPDSPKKLSRRLTTTRSAPPPEVPSRNSSANNGDDPSELPGNVGDPMEPRQFAAGLPSVGRVKETVIEIGSAALSPKLEDDRKSGEVDAKPVQLAPLPKSHTREHIRDRDVDMEASSSRPVDPSDNNDPRRSSFTHFPPPPADYDPDHLVPVSRQPPDYPRLAMESRYCKKCNIVKPYRAHHCRHCATCVLKFDHHCPWVGGCVGARNYKYFYNFLQWSSLYCIFVFITVMIAVIRRQYPHSVDAQQIVVIALSFLFTIFTAGLCASHTKLLLYNTTTVEEISMERMRRRERGALTAHFGLMRFRDQMNAKKGFDREWGKIETEGNIWWMDSKRDNWEMVMGKEKLPWILPIPAKPSGDDGLHYRVNPRFSEDGRWRRRAEWPQKLR